MKKELTKEIRDIVVSTFKKGSEGEALWLALVKEYGSPEKAAEALGEAILESAETE